MFDNIGGKIKTLAEVVCTLGIVASVLAGTRRLLRNRFNDTFRSAYNWIGVFRIVAWWIFYVWFWSTD